MQSVATLDSPKEMLPLTNTILQGLVSLLLEKHRMFSPHKTQLYFLQQQMGSRFQSKTDLSPTSACVQFMAAPARMGIVTAVGSMVMAVQFTTTAGHYQTLPDCSWNINLGLHTTF